jgi:hypothetical protein
LSAQDARQIEATETSIFATKSALDTLIAQQTALSSATPVVQLTSTPTKQNTLCQSIGDSAFQVITGPVLDPKPGLVYRVGQPPPQVSWVIQNTGNCSWSQIQLLSMLDNKIVLPIIKRNGQVFTPTGSDGPAFITPGEQIEVALEFPATKAQKVNGDWVLFIDGLALSAQPHLLMQIDSWVIVNTPVVPTPTKTRKPAGTSSGPPIR